MPSHTSQAIDEVGLDRSGHPRRRLDQRQLGLDLGVAAAAPAPAAAGHAAKHVVAEERTQQVAEGREVHELIGVELALGDAGVPEAVVPGAGVGVAQHLVGLGGLAELLAGRRLGIHIRVQLTGKPSERLLDVGIRGVLCNAQDFVVVTLRHAPIVDRRVASAAYSPHH